MKDVHYLMVGLANMVEEQRRIHEQILREMSALEKYQESTKQSLKTEKDFRKICYKATSLYNKLREEFMVGEELTYNDLKYKTFLQNLKAERTFFEDLKTLTDEADQEQIDKLVVKVTHRRILKTVPRLLEGMANYYMFNGPESNKDVIKDILEGK